eukprot:14177980-Ditylum_brightwellii.AAC.1
MDELVHMKLEGRLAELLVCTAPQVYKQYVTIDQKGKKILYMKLRKALYVCLKSALLFYRKLSGDLIKNGFEINPYNPCVAKKMVDRKQLTVTWHFDNLKVSHKKKQVVDDFLECLSSNYGQLRTTWGKSHDYLGMELDYSTSGEVQVAME